MLKSQLRQATLPVDNPTRSYWQIDKAQHLESTEKYIFPTIDRLNFQAADRVVISLPVPENADIVIIGSGYTGAMVALDLLRTLQQGTNVVMLEARGAVSGATGRNGSSNPGKHGKHGKRDRMLIFQKGGHIKPDPYLTFPFYRDLVGADEAVKQCVFEQENFRETVDFIRREGLELECDLATLDTADIFMTEKAFGKGVDALRQVEAAGGDVSKMQVWDKERAQKVCSAMCMPGRPPQR
jgi:hypothetical protein